MATGAQYELGCAGGGQSNYKLVGLWLLVDLQCETEDARAYWKDLSWAYFDNAVGAKHNIARDVETEASDGLADVTCNRALWM